MVPSKMQFLVSRICHTGPYRAALPSPFASTGHSEEIIASWLQPTYRHRSRKYRHCAALEDDINVCTGQPAGVQPVVASLHHVSRPRLGMLVPVCAHVDSCLFRRQSSLLNGHSSMCVAFVGKKINLFCKSYSNYSCQLVQKKTPPHRP
jgi:hypothetical protein